MGLIKEESDMANIRKRGNTYQIRVSCGYNTKGEQVVQTMSWRPPAGMTEKQAEKEVQKQAILFEDRCMKGQVTANVKFEDFAEEWLESYAKLNLRNTSYERMKQLRTRVYPAIGHLRMDKITARHIQHFITDLALNGKSLKTGKPLSRKTVVHHLSFISDVFSYAVKMEMLSDNPCRRVTVPKGEKKEKQIYTLEEVEQLFNLSLVIYRHSVKKSADIFILGVHYTTDIKVHAALKHLHSMSSEFSCTNDKSCRLLFPNSPSFNHEYAIGETDQADKKELKKCAKSIIGYWHMIKRS